MEKHQLKRCNDRQLSHDRFREKYNNKSDDHSNDHSIDSLNFEDQSNKRHEPLINYDKNRKILLRKNKLFEHLNDEKLIYVKNGICDSYIKFGTPSLKDVVNNIQNKSEKQIKRLRLLLKRLKEEGELYDENISYYEKYIKNGNDLTLTVEEGIKEWFYINKTNYLEILKIYKDEDIAQAIAYNNYIKKNGPDKYTERIRNTEMILKIY